LICNREANGPMLLDDENDRRNGRGKSADLKEFGCFRRRSGTDCNRPRAVGGVQPESAPFLDISSKVDTDSRHSGKAVLLGVLLLTATSLNDRRSRTLRLKAVGGAGLSRVRQGEWNMVEALGHSSPDIDAMLWL
jgi:hypothetical protein